MHHTNFKTERAGFQSGLWIPAARRDRQRNTRVNVARNTLTQTFFSIVTTLKKAGGIFCLLPLLVGLLPVTSAHAVQGDEFIALPRYNLTDRFSVNHYSSEASVSVDTVSIGGERGLSHSIHAKNNFVSYPGNRGYTDKFAAALQYKVVGKNVKVKMGEQTYPLVWVMSASALGESADFLVKRNGAYAFDNGRDFTSNYEYVALGDARHTLKVEGGSRVWTQPDGTQVFFGISSAGAGHSSSASKIVYPNGFTLYLHYDTGVTTNTGFQLKFDYVDDDPGLPPEKQGRVFPGSTNVPPEEPPELVNWWLKNPKHVRGINNAVEYCNPHTIHPCSLAHDWPTATFFWPGGMPRAVFIDDTTVSIVNAAGQTTRLHYQAQDGALIDMNDPTSVIANEVPNSKIAPRLVAVTPAGADEPTVHYTYKNLFDIVATGHGSSARIDYGLLPGKVLTAQGIRGANVYIHSRPQGGNEGQWGETVYFSDYIQANVSSSLPGTLQELYIFRELGISSFEASYRNFPNIVTDYSGPTKDYDYDSRGNVNKVTYLPAIDGQNVVYTAGYPASCANPKTCNKPLWIKDARQNALYSSDDNQRTDYTYHPQSGQIATVTGPSDDNGIRPVTRYTYEQKYAWYKKDSNSVEQADTPIWLLTREATCRTTATVGDACAGGDLDEVVTEYDYGPQDGSPNNLFLRGVTVTAEVDGALQSRTTCYQYDIYGHRIGETLPKGTAGGCDTSAPQQAAAYRYAKRYTPAGQLTGEISPDPDGNGPRGFHATLHEYDDYGRLARTDTGELATWQDETAVPETDWNMTVLGSVLYQYDEYGRKIETRSLDANGQLVRRTHTNYDARGNVLCTALRMNLAATASTDACTATSGADGQDRVTRHEYTGLLDLLKVEWRAYDTPWQQKYAEYTYDNKLVTSVTDANGNKTVMDYDGHGRLTHRYYPSKIFRGQINEDDYQQYRYDVNGNLRWERKRNEATFTYKYDRLNRMITKIPNDGGRTVSYGYDLRGLQIFAKFNDTGNPGITHQYDGFGQLTRTTSTLGGISRVLNYDYDQHGNRTRITHPDGISFSYQFDGLDRVSGVGEGSSTSNLLTIPYHANGGRDSLLRSSGANTLYAYDDAQRIDQLTQNLAGTSNDLTTGFDFNPAGQITRLTRSNDLYHYFGNSNKTGAYIANGLNQYKSVNGQNYGYDPNGNLTSDGVNTYTYDNENRLTAVAGSVNATLEYDPLGRLFKVTANGVTRQFLYDGDALVAEYSASNTTPVVRYVHGDQVDEPWVQYNGASVGQNQRVYLHTDHQHSVIAHSNGLGNSVNTLRYDVYGLADTSNVGRFGYTGQVWLADIGLYYYKARMYSPSLGRFLQTDPIGYEDQMNLYAYVGNDPMNATDPTGTACYAMKHGIGSVCAGQGLLDSLKSSNQEEQPTADAIADGIATAVETGLEFSGALDAAETALKTTVELQQGDIDGAREVFATGMVGMLNKKIKLGKEIIEIIGGKFKKITEIRKGRDGGQSRAEYVRIKNAEGKTIRTYKDSYDRSGKFQHRKPLRGGPEGRE